jgi:hypothetical protein
MPRRGRTGPEPCRKCRVDAIDASLADALPRFGAMEALKFGAFTRCTDCGIAWFFNADRTFLSKIPEHWVESVRRWSDSDLTIGSDTVSALASIGASEPVHSASESITIPCTTRSVSGQVHEKAIVTVSRRPPGHWSPQPRWGNELESVTASRWALPLTVRRAFFETVAESMGFRPVRVLDPKRTEYTLADFSHFFNWNGVAGSDLRLSDRQKRWWELRWRNIVWPCSAQAYYVVDWFTGCETLLCSWSRTA